MDLQDQGRGRPGVPETPVDADQGHLEHVCGQTLNRGVHGLPLPRQPDVVVRRRELRYAPTAAEQGLRVALLSGLCHRPVHVGTDRRKGLEVRVEDLGGLLHRRTEALGQAVGLHAVGQAVCHHLRPVADLGGDLRGVDAPGPRGHGGVHVVSGLEGGDEPRVVGQVGDAAQLYLVVVGHQQGPARRRHEGPPECTAGLGTDRDVVEVRGVGAEPTRPGHRLVERRPDPVSRPDRGQQALAVRGAELLDLPVGQQVINYRVVPAEPFQGRSVGRVPGLGLLPRGEAQLSEEDLPELLGGVHVELLPGSLVHHAPKPVAVRRQLVAQPGQLGHVDPHAQLLHPGQHGDQGHLEGGVQLA